MSTLVCNIFNSPWKRGKFVSTLLATVWVGTRNVEFFSYHFVLETVESRFYIVDHYFLSLMVWTELANGR